MTTLTAKPALILRGAICWLALAVAATVAAVELRDASVFYGVAAIGIGSAVLTLRALLPGRYQITISDQGVDLRFNTQNPGFFAWDRIDRAEMANAATRNGRRSRRKTACLFVRQGRGQAAVPLYARMFGLRGEELCRLINQAKHPGSSLTDP